MLLPIEPLDRVLGDRTAKSFAKHLGLRTVADLLQHFPRRYATRGALTPISELPIGEPATVVADTDVRLLILQRCEFDRLLDNQPKVAAKILLRIARLLSHRLRETTGQLAEHLA
jgi:CRP-like cAMP-binding protein